MSDLSSALLAGPLSATVLIAQLGVSQPTLSRMIQQHGQIIKWGKARNTRYALLRPLRGMAEFSLWRINADGKAHSAGTLWSVWPQGRCLVEDEHHNWHYYDGLPWFLTDMRPQGFLGRLWGRETAPLLNLTQDIRLWNDDQNLMALAHSGYDMPGEWIIGQTAYQCWLNQAAVKPVTQDQKNTVYPQRAAQVLNGEEPGSSAGGEQPKFLCYAETAAGYAQHCLVKFSGAQDNEISQRWRDLLRAEHIALQIQHDAGISAAQSSLLEIHGQVFLEMSRFDRNGLLGRRGIVSLEAVSAEFLGQQLPWPAALRELSQQKLIDNDAVERGTLQWAFGRLIANSDMHAGNLSFFLQGAALRLTPAYDVLPMALSPGLSGQLADSVQLRLDLSLPYAVWQPARELAGQFWQQVADREEISVRFRMIAREALTQLAALDSTLRQMA
ncbi:type II toxin-antitoxin system HipA family toxin YjjJ [uncultured Pantoea sp.]|uniref:type II toxin-antitoxin system HipA family toxin YjjJ n=1 Tax=uncultured Pantoea sp. TaxID=218084 RepID=UPI00258C9734|nr:type II toxin-antitoxin system HipA family toxin YjjJ [uncultured Pantoea sp.]